MIFFGVKIDLMNSKTFNIKKELIYFMKIRIYFLPIVVFILLNGIVYAVCTDSDGGVNYYKKGEVIDKYGKYTDYCYMNYLREYYCTSYGIASFTLRYCSQGCSNGACTKEEVQKQPDLTITDITHYVKVDGDGVKRFYTAATIKNIGNKDAGGFSVYRYVNGAFSCSGGYRELKKDSSVTLTCGTPCNRLNTGENTITYKVDVHNQVDELNETNNEKTIKITNPCEEKPDLIVTDISWTPANPKVEDEICISATIKNIGTKAIDGSTLTAWTYVNGYHAANTFYGKKIGVGELLTKNTLCSKYGKNVWFKKGKNIVTVEIDPKDVNIIDESNESNNERTETLTITEEKGEQTCTDSDGGVNYYKKGEVIDKYGKKYADYCIGDYIREYYCTPSNTAAYLDLYCSLGCSKDACTKEKKSTILPCTVDIYGKIIGEKPCLCNDNLCNSDYCCNGRTCQASTCGPSKMNLTVILLTDISFYLVGDPCTGKNCCGLYEPNYKTPIITFANNGNYKILKPDDPSVDNYAQKILVRLQLNTSEVQNIKSQINDFVSKVAEDSKGAIILNVTYVELRGGITMSQWGCEFWIDPKDVKPLLSNQVTKNTDFVLVFSNIYDSSKNACIEKLPFCGGMRGADNNFFGVSYSYIPKTDSCVGHNCAKTKTIYHEWLHELDFALEKIIGVSDIYQDNFPKTLCGNADPDAYKWFPSPDSAAKDPDFPACVNYYDNWPGYCNAIKPIDCDYQWDAHLLSKHYNPSISLIGNHCRNGKQDFNEKGVDCGGSCKPCSKAKQTPRPDLIVTDIKLYDNENEITNPMVGKAYTVKAIVKNQGTKEVDFESVLEHALILYINGTQFTALDYDDLDKDSPDISPDQSKIYAFEDNWTPTKATNYEFKVKIDADNLITESNESNNERTETVTVTEKKGEQTYSLKLYKGWNMISSPVNRTISISEIEKNCKLLSYRDYKIWYWNTSSGNWDHPTVLEPGLGYYIKVNEDCTADIIGEKFKFKKQKIYKGWNMIAPGETSLGAILGTCNNHLIPYKNYLVWKWDPKTKDWKHTTDFELGQGYYIKSDANCNLGD